MQEPNPNDATLKVYDQRIGEYLEHTPLTYSTRHDPLLRWLNFSLKLISKKDGVIFEIGSGHGRDANYIKQKGYNILCSDGAPSFVKYLNSKGQDAIIFNAIKDPLDKTYNLILANAVIPHFTPENLRHVLKKVHSSLVAGGVFAFSTKQGQGEEWINEKFELSRYVHFWSPDDLRHLLEECDFKIIFYEYNISGGDIPEHTWIHVVAQKV